jgi:hypothetical protein
VPKGATILLDTTVYIDQLKGDLPPPIIELIATRLVHHGAPALAELAAAIGYLPVGFAHGSEFGAHHRDARTRAASKDSCAE